MKISVHVVFLVMVLFEVIDSLHVDDFNLVVGMKCFYLREAYFSSSPGRMCYYEN